MANRIPFKSRSKPTQKTKKTPMMYKFTFVYYEDVMQWAKSNGNSMNTRIIECTNIPSACELFHDSIRNAFPNYYISSINVLPIVPGLSKDEQPTEE